ncbi:MAG: response regulator [Phycisphaerales bacterium]|nr:response regulator [Phycisphaerales bacterium]
MQDGKHVILYVEDDADFRDSLRMVLEAHGYVMVEAATAEKGLVVYKEQKPDFVIVDLMMEEVDAGTNFVKELKVLGNEAPVYMLSSVGDDLTRTVSPAELGLTGVFQKPIDHAALLGVLKTVFGT